jgi:hypothetical protein
VSRFCNWYFWESLWILLFSTAIVAAVVSRVPALHRIAKWQNNWVVTWIMLAFLPARLLVYYEMPVVISFVYTFFVACLASGVAMEFEWGYSRYWETCFYASSVLVILLIPARWAWRWWWLMHHKSKYKRSELPPQK